MWDKEFKFILTWNESADRFEELGTANFEPSFDEMVIKNVDSFEGAIGEFKQKCNFSSGDWYWESNHDGTFGKISTDNDSDGLELTFEVELIRK